MSVCVTTISFSKDIFLGSESDLDWIGIWMNSFSHIVSRSIHLTKSSSETLITLAFTSILEGMIIDGQTVIGIIASI